jgi:hypothetical protein
MVLAVAYRYQLCVACTCVQCLYTWDLCLSNMDLGGRTVRRLLYASVLDLCPVYANYDRGIVQHCVLR